MRRFTTIAVVLSIVFGSTVKVRPYTVQLTDPLGSLQIKWSRKRIAVALSPSLNSPGPQIKIGSDVVGALRRAMARWSSVASIQFVEVSSRAQSISPTAVGDGISLITIGDTPENNALFAGSNNTGRTRVFYDAVTGAISEADVVINPHPVSADGSPVQFSTDGTPGTYDLESAFTHELGHLLGLEHSAVIGATMQARQGLNGLYHLASETNRTLSEDDRAAVRGIYGPHEGLGAIEGKLQNNSSGRAAPVFGAHVWAESVESGRLIASSITLADGSYRIESLSPGQYRVNASYLDGAVMAEDIASPGGAYAGIAAQSAFRTAELSAKLTVNPGAAANLNWTIKTPQSVPPALKPKLLGLGAQLSSVAVPIEAGKTYVLYVGGEGVDQVPATAITVSSPFMTVSPASLTRQQFGASFPVVSFEVKVAPNAPFGDYSIRLQASSGEVAFLAGGLTVDPGVNSGAANPADDALFFVGQQYRDFLGRDADQNGLEYWVNQISVCGTDTACINSRRIAVSAAFFSQTEFHETGSFVYRLYKSALGRQPRFSEFIADREQIVADASLQANKVALAQAFVERAEFQKKYPEGMNAEQFVDALLATVMRSSGAGFFAQRQELLGLYNGNGSGRAAIIRRLAESETFADAEYNRAFVLMQYFAYLKRDPDPRGYEFWLNVLNSKPERDPSAAVGMVCSFLSSTEYQARFGMTLTHSNGECGE